MADRMKLQQLLTEQTRRTPGLLAQKLESQSNFGHVQTGALLGELSEDDVAEARSDFEQASSEYASAVDVRQNLRSRLIDPSAEAQLIAAKHDIEALKPDYTQQVIDVFTSEYEIAASAFARVLARGKALSAALRVPIDMPVPQPAMEPNGVDGTALAEAMRVGSMLDGLGLALNEIVNERAQVQREKNRRAAYGPGQVWRFVRDYPPLFEAGDLTQAPIVSEAMLERLHRQRYIVAATADGNEPSAAAAGELDAAPMPA